MLTSTGDVLMSMPKYIVQRNHTSKKSYIGKLFRVYFNYTSAFGSSLKTAFS